MRKKNVCGGEKHSAWPPLFAVRVFLGKNGAKKRVSAALYHQRVRPLDDTRLSMGSPCWSRLRAYSSSQPCCTACRQHSSWRARRRCLLFKHWVIRLMARGITVGAIGTRRPKAMRKARPRCLRTPCLMGLKTDENEKLLGYGQNITD